MDGYYTERLAGERLRRCCPAGFRDLCARVQVTGHISTVDASSVFCDTPPG